MTESNVVFGKSVSIEVTPTVSASSAYTAEDQVGGIQTISETITDHLKRTRVVSPAADENSVATLLTVTVHDKAKQSAALEIFFFDELPTVASSDNAAISITDAEMAGKCVGVVSIGASDYKNVAASSIACVGLSQALAMRSKTDNGVLYAVAKTTGTPTYASTTDLVFRYVFGQDQ